MKKYKSLLNNKPILYLLFVLTLANLSYFIYIKDNYSILIFALIATLIYMFSTNMIIVLGLSIFLINILILARDSREGFETPNSCFEFTDAVITNMITTDISGVKTTLEQPINEFKLKIKDSAKKAMDGEYTDSEFYNEYMVEYNNLKDDEAKEWLDDNIVNSRNFSFICNNKKETNVDVKNMQKKEALTNELDDKATIKETEESDKNLNSIIKKVKMNNPEIEDSLKALNGIDMNELNKLINKLNTFSDAFTGKK